MNPYTDKKELKKRCKNPKFCIACFRARDCVPVDEPLSGLPKRINGHPRRLCAVTLKNGKTYFLDDRLRELRNIHNPGDRIDLEDLSGTHLLP
jgi:hypothetical protein